MKAVAYSGILKKGGGGGNASEIFDEAVCFWQSSVSQAGVWELSPQPPEENGGMGAKPPATGKILTFLAKITSFGDHF